MFTNKQTDEQRDSIKNSHLTPLRYAGEATCTINVKHRSCFSCCKRANNVTKGKGKVLSYSLSVGPGADPGVQAVSPQVTLCHPPGGRLPLLSARPAVTFPAEERHRPSAGTKLYCLVTKPHVWAACPWKRTGWTLTHDLLDRARTLYHHAMHATSLNCSSKCDGGAEWLRQ